MKYLAFAFLVGCSSAPLIVDLVREVAEGRRKEEKVEPKEPERIYSTPEEAAEVIYDMEMEACRMEKQGVIFKREIEVCE